MIKITIPNKVCSGFDGYNFLAKFQHYLFQLHKEIIVLDFSKNIWFEANLCAILGALIHEAEKQFNQFKFESFSSKVEEIFMKNHFLASFGGYIISDSNDTTIKYRKNKMSDEKLIREFLNNELINKPDFPKLSEAAKKEVIRSIFEIYSNAILHGNSEFVFSCGQFYPKKKPPRIDFTIVDIGRTFKKNVNEHLQTSKSGIEAIQWALLENNTTKPKEKNIPGGLGLKIICDFAKLNNGKVHIVSSDGCWELNRGKENSFVLEKPFLGTLVNLEFNLDDNSFYYLKNEKQEDIIF